MKPRVTTKCVADRYASRCERIIEFSHEGKGGLISFQTNAAGELIVCVYRCDKNVRVIAQTEEGSTREA